MNHQKHMQNSLFLILSGLFIASLISCNLIFQKFFHIDIWIPFIGIYSFEQSVGLLPYPITFLVTDIISEIYGKKKANQVVLSGLIASFFMLLIVTAADYVNAATWSPIDNVTFSQVFGLSGAAVFASMMAYLFAQFIDVRIFHFWKRLTNGKHLWIRNNGSTIASQLVDTTLVICILFVGVWESDQILSAIFDGWLFKMMMALIDTPIIYGILHLLKGKIEIANLEEG